MAGFAVSAALDLGEWAYTIVWAGFGILESFSFFYKPWRGLGRASKTQLEGKAAENVQSNS